MDREIDTSKHAEMAGKIFEQGYNCSQAVLLAFCNITGLDWETAAKLASSFGGGMGSMGEVCGAVTGAFMVLGLLYGNPDPADKEAKVEHSRRIFNYALSFQAENGSLLCRELLQLPEQETKPAQINKSLSALEVMPCTLLVKRAAALVDSFIEGYNG